jgi:hypothetical protein
MEQENSKQMIIDSFFLSVHDFHTDCDFEVEKNNFITKMNRRRERLINDLKIKSEVFVRLVFNEENVDDYVEFINLVNSLSPTKNNVLKIVYAGKFQNKTFVDQSNQILPSSIACFDFNEDITGVSKGPFLENIDWNKVFQ